MRTKHCCCCIHYLRCTITSSKHCCGRDILSLKEVKATLGSKKLNEKFEVKAFGTRDDLVARGRSSTSDNKRGKRRSKLRTKNGGNKLSIKCNHCNKEEHTKKLYPKRQKKTTNLGRLFGSGK